MSEPSSILIFVGRFHPLLVHLPIGILVVLGFLELIARWPRHRQAAANASGYLLALAVPASILSAILGWMLSKEGGYEERLLNWHFWSGIATAVLCTLTAILYAMQTLKAYRAGLTLTLATLVVASHFGGSLTHGSDYLVRYLPGRPRSAPAAQSSPATKQRDPSAFEAVIHPILEKNCIGCHGPERSKAGLRFDTAASLLKGGEHGPVVLPGSGSKSEIIEHMRLPIDHDEHMPPKGKPQPSGDDIALIEWWIDTGASSEAKIGDLDQPPEVKRILSGRMPVGVTGEPKAKGPNLTREQALTIAVKLESSVGVAISPLSQDGAGLLVNASLMGTNFGDAELQKLTGSQIAPVIEILDLAGTSVTDSGLAGMARFTSLKRLHLERTGLGDKAMPCISGLRSLEYLNLYGTTVTDAGLSALKTLPNLTRIYLWGTKVTPEGAKGLESARLAPEEKLRLEREIEALQARIRDQQIFVHLGAPTQPADTNASSTNAVAAVAVNTICPISGKPVNAAKTLNYEGKVYAFCCEDCLNKAKEDPKGVLAKLAGRDSEK